MIYFLYPALWIARQIWGYSIFLGSFAFLTKLLDVQLALGNILAFLNRKPVYVIGGERCRWKFVDFQKTLRQRGLTRALTGGEDVRISLFAYWFYFFGWPVLATLGAPRQFEPHVSITATFSNMQHHKFPSAASVEMSKSLQTLQDRTQKGNSTTGKIYLHTQQFRTCY